tara:strand:- start:22 stop:699 length:678 start_codon:yes stop_codon:yes gene_type:complete
MARKKRKADKDHPNYNKVYTAEDKTKMIEMFTENPSNYTNIAKQLGRFGDNAEKAVLDEVATQLKKYREIENEHQAEGGELFELVESFTESYEELAKNYNTLLEDTKKLQSVMAILKIRDVKTARAHRTFFDNMSKAYEEGQISRVLFELLEKYYIAFETVETSISNEEVEKGLAESKKDATKEDIDKLDTLHFQYLECIKWLEENIEDCDNILPKVKELYKKAS